MLAVLYGVLIVVVGTVLLRIAGRRSIAQMTFGSVMVLLAIGTIIAKPVERDSLSVTLASCLAMVLTLIVIEWLEVKFNWFEHIVSGHPVVVIENGMVHAKHLRKLRLTEDKLEMRLRQIGVKHLSDVKTATMEANGQLGYELQPGSEPLTVAQFEQALTTLVPELMSAIRTALSDVSRMPKSANIFNEVEQPTDTTHPKPLQ